MVSVVTTQTDSAGAGSDSVGLPSSPRPRRISSPRWLDPRLLAGVAVMLVAVVLGVRLLTGPGRPSTPVWALTRDVPAGTVLAADDLRIARVRLDHGADRYLAAGSTAVGRTVDQPLSRGQLVPRAAVADQAAQATVSFVLAPENAPTLARGQRVELWVTTPTCRGFVVLGEVAVTAVQAGGTSAFATGTGQSVTVRVSPEAAVRVATAAALPGAVLQAGVLSGPAPSVTLPDLADCAGKR